MQISVSIGDIATIIFTIVAFSTINFKIQKNIIEKKQENNIEKLENVAEKSYIVFSNIVKVKYINDEINNKDKNKICNKAIEDAKKEIDALGVIIMNYGNDDIVKLFNYYSLKCNKRFNDHIYNKTADDEEWLIPFFAVLHAVAKAEATGIHMSPRYLISNLSQNLGENEVYNKVKNKANEVICEAKISKKYLIKTKKGV